MAARDELERAVIAAGISDPGPLLVYADWLQERGDPLGRLITVMHAREGTDTHALAAEEAELVEAHLAEWLGPAYGGYQTGELELVWRRGVVAAARIRKFEVRSADDPFGMLRDLLAQPAARFIGELAIDLASFGIDPHAQAIEALALPDSITRVDFGRATGPAVLELLAIPEQGFVEGYAVGARIPVTNQRFVIGRVPGCALVCYAPGQGGRRNSGIDLYDGRYVFSHYGHSLPITFNGWSWNGHIGYGIVLCHGDRIEPGPGLVLRFAIDGVPRVIELRR